MNFSYLMYTTPPPCSALRCQPMGTWTGTACLSSPASQSFPPFIAPLVLRSTPQRYIYQTSTSVFAMHVMFVFQSRGGVGRGRVAEMGRAERLCFNVGLCSQVEPMGWWVVGQGEASSRQTLPFELLHGYGAEWCVDFHYCILSFRAIRLGKMLAEEVKIGSRRALCFLRKVFYY